MPDLDLYMRTAYSHLLKHNQISTSRIVVIYGLVNEFKYHLVNWSKVSSSISEGGLGIHNLLFN